MARSGEGEKRSDGCYAFKGEIRDLVMLLARKAVFVCGDKENRLLFLRHKKEEI